MGNYIKIVAHNYFSKGVEYMKNDRQINRKIKRLTRQNEILKAENDRLKKENESYKQQELVVEDIKAEYDEALKILSKQKDKYKKLISETIEIKNELKKALHKQHFKWLH